MKKNLTFYSILFIAFFFLQRGSGLITKLILANTVTPYEYGLITLVALSLPTFFQILMYLNFSCILSHATEGRNYFGFAILSSFIIGIIISVFLFIYQNNFFEFLNIPTDNRWLFYWTLIISMFSLGIITDFYGLLTGLRLYSLPGLISAIPSVIRLGFVLLLLILNKLSFETIILFFAISNTIPLIYLIFSRNRQQYLPYIKSFNIPTKKMLAFGTALFIVGTYSTIGMLLIKVVVSHKLGIIWQGYFDISMTLVSVAIFLLGTMNFISVPEATNSDRTKIHKNSELSDVSRALFSQMFILLIIMYFYSEFIVGILFPDKYIYAAQYCYILVIAYIFLYVQNYLANLNISFAKTPKEYLIQAALPLLLLPFFFILTEKSITFLESLNYGNGFVGAYLSYCIVIITLTLFTIICSKDLKYLSTFIYKSEKLIFSFALTFSLILLTSLPALIGIPASFILFNCFLFYFGYLDKTLITEIFNR